MKRIVFFLAAVLVCRSSHAQTLLAVFEFTQPEPITLPANYAFSIDNDGAQQTVFWPAVVNAYPFTESAVPELVERFNAITTNSSNNIRRVRMHNDFQPINQFNSASFDSIWFPDDPTDGFRAEAFVPNVPDPSRDPLNPLYTGLWGYIVTGLERTITAEGQLVRIYGHPIPEPAALVLFLVAIAHVASMWRRRSRSLFVRSLHP